MANKKSIGLILFLAFVPLVLSPVARGERVSSLDREKEKLQNLERNVKKSKEVIKRQQSKERSILKELHKLEQVLDKRKKESAIYEANLAQNQKKMGQTQGQISKLEEEIKQNMSSLKKRLKAMYKSGGVGLVRVIFSVSSLSELIQSMNLMRYIARSDACILTEMKQKRQAYLDKMKELESYRDKVNLYKSRALQEKKALEKERKERESLLASIRRDKDTQASLVKDLEERSKELRNIIHNWNTRSSISENFRDMKGRLIWPVQGNLLIPFGLHYDNRLDRKILNNGIDIRADLGSHILSVSSGKVLYAGWFWGYGKLIIIDHGKDYTSIYAHASEIFVKEGQNVKTGEKIASVGDTDSIRGPELYFEIRYKGRPLNPVLWLSRQDMGKMFGKKEGLPNNR